MNNTLQLHPIACQTWNYLLPVLVLSIVGVLNLFCSPFLKKGRKIIFMLSILSFFSMIAVSFQNLFRPENVTFYEMLFFDRLGSFSSIVILIISFISFLALWGNDLKEHLLQEVFALLLFTTCGMLLLVNSLHLIFIFVALEIMSLAIYVMVAMKRRTRFSAEASLKYFIMGGVASAFFLYGSALIFGNLGTFDLGQMNMLMAQRRPEELKLLLIGSLMIIGAVLFKVGAFPFHAWVPDVYQGALSPVTGLMAAGVKYTAFILFIRLGQNLFFAPSFPYMELMSLIFSVVALITMFYGNLVALRQLDLKRLLAYSAIAHTGYLFLGVMAGRYSLEGYQAVLVYLIFYALSTLGIFAIIARLKVENQKDLPLRYLQGLGKRDPFTAICLSIFLFSFAGIPLSAGFIGKYFLFISAIGKLPLVILILAIVSALIALGYYIRIIAQMFMKDPYEDRILHTEELWGTLTVICLTTVFTILFGLFPEKIMKITHWALF